MAENEMVPIAKRIGLGGFAFDTLINFGAYKLSGEGFKKSLIKGAETALLWNAIGPVGNVLAIGGGIATGVSALYEAGRAKFYRNLAYGYDRGNIGGNYVDTKQAYTMRQAAVQAIAQARINGRQVLGNEASFLHR